MSPADVLSGLLILASLVFFTAGTVGLVRMPDVHCRLHALTKADNVGLGLAVLALVPQADDLTTVFKLLLTWVLVLASGATISFLFARRASADRS